jgi:hypothetical protein
LELRCPKEREALAAAKVDRQREEVDQQDRLETKWQLQQAARESVWNNNEPAESNNEEEDNTRRKPSPNWHKLTQFPTRYNTN